MPVSAMPRYPEAIQAPSRMRSSRPAINRLATTKPMEVSPSCSPYSKVVALSARTANGSSRAFDRPNASRVGTWAVNSERRIGVSKSWRRPAFRFFNTTVTLVSSSAARGLMRIMKIQAAENTNEAASRKNAQRISVAPAIRPEAAKPTAVAPKELIAIKEFAAASSCSEATSGSTLSWAGSKNCPMALQTSTMT